MQRKVTLRGVTIAALAMLAAGMVGSGCFGSGALDPGADPVVVNAERVLRTSFAAVDSFLAVDDVNRATLKASFPAAHQFAEMVRQNAPQRNREAWAALDAYKAARDASTGDALKDKLKMVQAIADQARDYLMQLEQGGVNIPPKAKAAAARVSA